MSTQLVRIDTKLKESLDEKRGPLSISKYLQFALMRGEFVELDNIIDPELKAILQGVN